MKKNLNESKKIEKILESTDIKLTEGYFENSKAQLIKEASEIRDTFARWAKECDQAVKEFQSCKTPPDFITGLKTITTKLDSVVAFGLDDIKYVHKRFEGSLKFTIDKGYEKFWKSQV